MVASIPQVIDALRAAGGLQRFRSDGFYGGCTYAAGVWRRRDADADWIMVRATPRIWAYADAMVAYMTDKRAAWAPLPGAASDGRGEHNAAMDYLDAALYRADAAMVDALRAELAAALLRERRRDGQ